MSFKNYLKAKLRYLFGIATMAALLSQLIAPIINTQAAEPRFNFLQGDYQILEGINATKGDTVWKNPVTGNAGDEFRGSVYYHNGIVDTIAKNTRIKVNIPSGTTNGSAKITASISADNAATVTSTIVNGQLVGLDGLVVNLDRDAEIEFIPGSVKWFPDANVRGPNAPPVALPFGQTGNEIVTSSGVNIGDIQGCWEFAGFVTFGFKTKVKQAPSIAVAKTVRNSTKGESAFVERTSAQIGEEVEFNIVASNTGDFDLSNAVIRDELPTGLIFVPGSFSKTLGGTTTPLSDTDAAQFFNGGFDFGTLARTQPVTFRFKTTASSIITASSLVNQAVLVAGGLTVKDTATVDIVSPNIVKSKSVLNNTTKEEGVRAKAKPGDLLTYTLRTRNTGTAGVSFTVEDDISDILKSADVVTISDGGSVSGNIIRWPAAQINPGQEIVRTFQVKVKNLTSNATIKNVFGNEVIVTVEVPAPPVVVKAPKLDIEKLVKNISTNEVNFVEANQAFAGDILEYQINFSNTGNAPADQARFSDTIPANTEYIAGTTRISRNAGAEQTLPDGITGAGITLDSIAVGEKSSIRFRVKTSGSLAVGEVLINTAFLTQAGKTISDTAKTTIIAKPAAAAAPAPSLPVTGSTTALSFLITFIGGIFFLYWKYRKMMNSEEAMIIGSLLAS